MHQNIRCGSDFREETLRKPAMFLDHKMHVDFRNIFQEKGMSYSPENMAVYVSSETLAYSATSY
jgi:hypothetical protein